MAENLCCVLTKPGEIILENRDILPPSKGEVQVAIHSVGICGSDLHLWRHGRIGDFTLTNPMILGHESSGTVTSLGEGVTELQVGDRVALEPAVPCRYCDACKTGRYNLCPGIKCLSVPPCNGSIARLHNHDQQFCYKLPDNVSLEEGALLEPLSVAIQACRRGEVKVGDTVLICGAGPIGLVNLLVARATGASKIIITDINSSRLEFAKKLGANDIILIKTGDPTKSTVAEIKEILGDLVDVTMECSGVESSIQLAVSATKSGGKVCLVGMGPSEIKLPLVEAGMREVDIRGVFRYVNTYPTAIKMVESGAVDVKPLVSHRYGLEEAAQAFNTAQSGDGNAVKVMINCQKL